MAQSNFQWRWVAGAKDEDEGIEIAKKFSLKDVAKNITCPFLVTHAGNDRVVPVENAQKLYDAVGSKNKTIKIFTTEEGGAEHAHVDNRQIGIDFAADWLEEIICSGGRRNKQWPMSAQSNSSLGQTERGRLAPLAGHAAKTRASLLVYWPT